MGKIWTIGLDDSLFTYEEKGLYHYDRESDFTLLKSLGAGSIEYLCAYFHIRLHNAIYEKELQQIEPSIGPTVDFTDLYLDIFHEIIPCESSGEGSGNPRPFTFSEKKKSMFTLAEIKEFFVISGLNMGSLRHISSAPAMDDNFLDI